MDTLIRPAFRELSREECEELLARHHLGRLAYARGRELEIEPLHYVYHDDEDPVPHRTVLFRISVAEVAGRQALPWPEEGAPG